MSYWKGTSISCINVYDSLSLIFSNLSLPVADLAQLQNLFSVLNLNVWDNLPAEDRLFLRQLLPPIHEGESERQNLAKLFSNDNINFGNPLSRFQAHLKGILEQFN